MATKKKETKVEEVKKASEVKEEVKEAEKVIQPVVTPTFYWMRYFDKVRIDLFVFTGLIVGVAFLLPHEALTGLLSLLASKVMTLTLGTMLAHLLRIVAFPYLDLSKMIEEHHWAGVVFMAMWYYIIIYSVAVGG